MKTTSDGRCEVCRKPVNPLASFVAYQGRVWHPSCATFFLERARIQYAHAPYEQR